MLKKSKLIRSLCLLLSTSILLASCSSTTIIQSSPEGAKLYLNGEPVGTTPYTQKDTKIVGSCTTVRLEKDGYETFTSNFCRNEEVELRKTSGPDQQNQNLPAENQKIDPKENDSNDTLSKAAKLRELKELLDEGIINQEEFDSEKQKILDGE
jgi:hypothetical protein